MIQPHSSNDPLKPLLDLLADFVSKSRRNIPGWKIELSRTDLYLACRRPCCKGLRDMNDNPRHRIHIQFLDLLEDCEVGFSTTIDGLSYYFPDACQPPYVCLPRGHTIDDAIACATEVLDLVPVCIQMLEADNIHWLKRMEMMDFG